MLASDRLNAKKANLPQSDFIRQKYSSSRQRHATTLLSDRPNWWPTNYHFMIFQSNELQFNYSSSYLSEAGPQQYWAQQCTLSGGNYYYFDNYFDDERIKCRKWWFWRSLMIKAPRILRVVSFVLRHLQHPVGQPAICVLMFGIENSKC